MTLLVVTWQEEMAEQMGILGVPWGDEDDNGGADMAWALLRAIQRRARGNNGQHKHCFASAMLKACPEESRERKEPEAKGGGWTVTPSCGGGCSSGDSLNVAVAPTETGSEAQEKCAYRQEVVLCSGREEETRGEAQEAKLDDTAESCTFLTAIDE